ncbi:integrase zinc binding domain-containing protein, partial [Enterobacter cloacae complex sp. 4DZ3-17B2]|uniref:integrase zinc binding domain-containing protein n=1 Tax=Enterobacter cloacae complex sp. 4DZ3-17B2 TaxID=2511990 RepID=UPI0013EBE1B9
ELHDQVMDGAHREEHAGHYGRAKTYHRVALEYYCPGMRYVIANYIRACPECRFQAAVRYV